ncbi:MAG: Mur ligase family protein, partial [Myxococcota bacterium]|nr:Mur ligase family protein [Myxococcota bacterium]
MLSIIEGGLEVLSRRGPDDTEVRAATADSRCVGDGTVFAAIPGTLLDGHDFIPQALASGASAVLLRDWPEGSEWPKDRVGIQVADPRRALALASHRLHGEPSQQLKVIGITGTNGKTSTVAILRSVLEAAGIPSGGIGTTGIEWMGAGGPVQHRATHTTPEGPVLFDWLARMRDDGVEAVALELSSHALEQGRAAGLALDVALWTNLSRDHLDYHGDMECYEAAKALLFGEWLANWGKPGATAVVNVDDPVVARHLEDHPRSLAVSSRPGARAEVRPLAEPCFSIDGCSAPIATPAGTFELRSRLLGRHNLANALSATACAVALGLDLDGIAAGIAASSGAPGRLERV